MYPDPTIYDGMENEAIAAWFVSMKTGNPMAKYVYMLISRGFGHFGTAMIDLDMVFVASELDRGTFDAALRWLEAKGFIATNADDDETGVRHPHCIRLFEPSEDYFEQTYNSVFREGEAA
jgi:hypothetical protein